MAGLSLKLVPTSSALKQIQKTVEHLQDKPKFYAAASEVMLDQVQMRFKNKQAPDGTAWAPHSAATIAKRGAGAPLLELSTDLRQGIHAAPTSDNAIVATPALPYAAIHNEGGKAGRGRSVEIPARPYMGFGDDDERELLELAESMVAAGW